MLWKAQCTYAAAVGAGVVKAKAAASGVDLSQSLHHSRTLKEVAQKSTASHKIPKISGKVHLRTLMLNAGPSAACVNAQWAWSGAVHFYLRSSGDHTAGSCGPAVTWVACAIDAVSRARFAAALIKRSCVVRHA